jgi:hypothetical protein
MRAKIADILTCSVLELGGAETGFRGTGFLVSRRIEGVPVPAGQEAARVFLVTNKHVIGDTAEDRRLVTSLDLHINLKSQQGAPGVGAVVPYILKDNWRDGICQRV